jgi:hypothetical protein
VIEPSSEITRGVVPKPHPYKLCLGTTPRATLSGRAALLTQEGASPTPTAFHQTRPGFIHLFIHRADKPFDYFLPQILRPAC